MLDTQCLDRALQLCFFSAVRLAFTTSRANERSRSEFHHDSNISAQAEWTIHCRLELNDASIKSLKIKAMDKRLAEKYQESAWKN